MMKSLIVKLLSSLLGALGYETETAVNGAEAVRKAKTGRPDLVLLDIMMPDMDGYEACELIKADAETVKSSCYYCYRAF